MKPALKHPKPKRPRPTKSIVKELDTLVSLIVRKRDGRCVVCGSTDNPQAGHFIGRRHYAVRWDLTNVHQQCAGCNIAHNSNPVPYTLFMEIMYGHLYPGLLNDLAKKPAPRRNERLALLAELKKIWEGMND